MPIVNTLFVYVFIAENLGKPLMIVNGVDNSSGWSTGDNGTFGQLSTGFVFLKQKTVNSRINTRLTETKLMGIYAVSKPSLFSLQCS